jgi:hypothetical protein
MESNYTGIIRDNLSQLYANATDSPENRLPAVKDGERYLFQAFGDTCVLSPAGITLGGEKITDPRGIIISLYALHAIADPCRLTPFKAYKEFPDTMPYAGAFSTHTEQILAPYTDRIMEKAAIIRERLNGDDAPDDMGGDMAFTVNPLPKIHLCYIFYAADEDFPASVTCLYSFNAADFLPGDALADVGEYTSKKIIKLVTP